MTYKELQEISELRKYTYEDYMCNQAMRDGEEIRIFLDSLEEETDRFFLGGSNEKICKQSGGR